MICKRILAATAIAAALATTGCATTGATNSALTIANNDLARLANYDVPAACGIISVAEGYFATLKPKISAKNQLVAAKASAAAASICANPPTNVAAAFLSLYTAWMAIQTATVSS